MIHLKIISALFPPDGKPHNSFIKIIPEHGLNTVNPKAIYITNTIKKTNNPKWDQDYYIPFYCFESVFLEFWDKKVFGENYFGKSKINFTAASFNQEGPQNVLISLENNTNNFLSYCTYSISSVFSSLNDLPSKPELSRIYIYLTYDPPLKLSQNEKVFLYIQKVNLNGTIYDKTFKEKEKAYRMGPSGLTDIYNFSAIFSDDICFFYVKSINYTGKVTLNIANSPSSEKMDQIHQYFLFFKDEASIQVMSQKDVNFCYSIFPYIFNISDKKLSLVNFKQFSQEINPQIFPIESQDQIQNTDDDFLNAFNYFHSNPEGIALKKILDEGIKGIDGSTDIYYYRFPIDPLKKYSIRSAFKFYEIEYKPINIDICFNFCHGNHFTYFVYISGENGKELSQLNCSPQNGIEINQNEIECGFLERLCFILSFDKIEKNIKYIAFIINSTKINVLNNSSICVVDRKSKKELMDMNINKCSGKKSVLAAILIKNDENDWMFWPCMQFYNGDGDSNAYEFINMFLTDTSNTMLY